jgi:hypothetical protein
MPGDEEYLMAHHHVAVRFPDGKLRVGQYEQASIPSSGEAQELTYPLELTPQDEPYLIRLAPPLELSGPIVLAVFGTPFLKLLADNPEAAWFYELARQAPALHGRYSSFRYLPMEQVEYLRIRAALAAPAFKHLSAFFAAGELAHWEELKSTYTLWLHTDREAYSTVEKVALAMAFETLREPKRAEEFRAWASFFVEDSKLSEAAVLEELERLLKST